MYRNDQKKFRKAGGIAFNQVFPKDSQPILMIILLSRVWILPRGKKTLLFLSVFFTFHVMKFYSILLTFSFPTSLRTQFFQHIWLYACLLISTNNLQKNLNITLQVKLFVKYKFSQISHLINFTIWLKSYSELVLL